MRTIRTIICLLFVAGTLPVAAQFNVEGDFRVRWYSDHFSDTRDGRGHENYMRYLARIRAKTRVGANTTFTSELISLIDNPGQPVRNIAGTGPMRFGISQVYAEHTIADPPVFDVIRFRVGRQQFPIGNGLTMGDSYYYLDKFDGGRVDLALYPFTLSGFAAITGQNLSSSGLYPDPGSDQLYAAKLAATVLKQDIIAYTVQQKLRGAYNDNITFGAGMTGELFIKDLDYFAEAAMQTFNTPPGQPEKGGIGYMTGLGYRWGWGPFRSIKLETRFAAYEGDDAKTAKVEMFSPPYPNFFWGNRVGYVNGDVGGDFPRNGRNLEGSTMWYTRMYFIVREFPKLRTQIQYIKVGEYVNNDGINSMDDEFSLRFYYSVSSQSALQLRFSRVIPNGGDADLNKDGTISSSEDRYSSNSYMFEWQIEF